MEGSPGHLLVAYAKISFKVLVNNSQNHPCKTAISEKKRAFFYVEVPFEGVNPDQIRLSNYRFRNIHNTENKLKCFQIYPETEVACKYNKPLYKTQYSKILVEYEDGFDMNTRKIFMHEMATSHSTTDEN